MEEQGMKGQGQQYYVDYSVEVHVPDLEGKLTGYLANHGFQRGSLDTLHPVDKCHFLRRDQREVPGAIGLLPQHQWRSPEDHLVYQHPEGTVAYVRPNPSAPLMRHALPFEVHLRTAASSGLLVKQYFSLAIPQRNLRLLLKALQSSGSEAISFIADMDHIHLLERLPTRLDEVPDDNLPVRVFHSVYVSRARKAHHAAGRNTEAPEGDEGDEKGLIIDDVSRAIGSVVVSSHLFSRKQIAYYAAAADIDQLFLDSALVG